MGRVRVEEPQTYVFTTEIDVRITDINYGGHLGHDRILSLAQEVRARFLNKHGFTELNIDGAGLIVRDAVISYKKEVFYGETLKIDMAVIDVKEKTCDFVYKFTETSSGSEVAMAKVGAVFFDYRRRKSAVIPEKFRTAVSA